MISVEEARKIIINNRIEFSTSDVNFKELSGCIIAEDIFTDRDFPPFDRVTMDGIAVNSSVLNSGKLQFVLEGLHPAGAKKRSLKDPEKAIEVMTGAILPEGTDCVIRYEDLEIQQRGESMVANVSVDEIQPFKNVHRKGEDRKEGELLIRKGTYILSPEIAVLASAGRSMVKVFNMPKTAIISTGDELIDVEDSPEEHQIRKSNIYAIQAELKSLGVLSELYHLADDKNSIESTLSELLESFPVVILSGGVSKGKLDFVPGILENLGIEKKFHTVSQRPGKPLWFGSSDKNVVFALPGNPVSTYMCFMIYVRMWYLQCLHLAPKVEYATLDTDASFTPKLTYFMQVKTYFGKNSKLMATPVIGHGSGDLANLIDAEGFMELAKDQTLFNRGSSFPVHLFRNQKFISDLKSDGSN